MQTYKPYPANANRTLVRLLTEALRRGAIRRPTYACAMAYLLGKHIAFDTVRAALDSAPADEAARTWVRLLREANGHAHHR